DSRSRPSWLCCAVRTRNRCRSALSDPVARRHLPRIFRSCRSIRSLLARPVRFSFFSSRRSTVSRAPFVGGWPFTLRGVRSFTAGSFRHLGSPDVRCTGRLLIVDKTCMRRSWWRDGVFYQIYPRSFQDANGDGVGDLAGITRRLDHLNDGTPASLGIDAIWISPFYRSPMADFGYDVSDYRDVDPIFGTLAAFDRLLEEAHRRGIRVLVDLVPNQP